LILYVSYIFSHIFLVLSSWLLEEEITSELHFWLSPPFTHFSPEKLLVQLVSLEEGVGLVGLGSFSLGICQPVEKMSYDQLPPTSQGPLKGL
jgi:hypothetical protein